MLNNLTYVIIGYLEDGLVRFFQVVNNRNYFWEINYKKKNYYYNVELIYWI